MARKFGLVLCNAMISSRLHLDFGNNNVISIVLGTFGINFGGIRFFKAESFVHKHPICMGIHEINRPVEG